MPRDSKLLARMRANPRGDWTIADIERLARAAGLGVEPPGGGSHYKVESPRLRR